MARKSMHPAILAAKIEAALEAAKILYEYTTESYLAALVAQHAAQEEFPRAEVAITARSGRYGSTYYVVRARSVAR